MTRMIRPEAREDIWFIEWHTPSAKLKFFLNDWKRLHIKR